MDQFVDLLKIVLPSTVVMYAMFLVVKALVSKEIESKRLEVKGQQTQILLPLRVQAYERMCLYLERISPNALLLRVNAPGMSVSDYHKALLSEIRNEYNHNVSQQMYMSDESWGLVKKATEDLIAIINSAAEKTPLEGKGLDLAKKIFEIVLDGNFSAIQLALAYLKNEIRELF